MIRTANMSGSCRLASARGISNSNIRISKVLSKVMRKIRISRQMVKPKIPGIKRFPFLVFVKLIKLINLNIRKTNRRREIGVMMRDKTEK